MWYYGTICSWCCVDVVQSVLYVHRAQWVLMWYSVDVVLWYNLLLMLCWCGTVCSLCSSSPVSVDVVQCWCGTMVQSALDVVFMWYSLLFMFIEPNGPNYQITMKGQVLQPQPTTAALLSNRGCVGFGGLALGQSAYVLLMTFIYCSYVKCWWIWCWVASRRGQSVK